jgi:hypothetical protein
MNPDEVARICDELHEYGPGAWREPGRVSPALKALRRLRAAGGRHENAAFHSLLLTRSEHDEYHPTQHLLRFQMSANLAGVVPRPPGAESATVALRPIFAQLGAMAY